jgi:hypothetical protein
VSIALVTEQEAVDHLRLDETDRNLNLYIEAASQSVIDYMNGGADEFLDSAGDVVSDSSGPLGVPANVRAAVLIWLGLIYENRSSSGTDNKDAFSLGDPPLVVKSLIYRRSRLSYA